MSVLPIIHLGHPKLRKESQKVSLETLKSSLMQQFLDNLVETCIAGNGVGIAAPQVGVNKRIIVVHVNPKNPRYPNRKPFPLTLVINPVIVSSSKEIREDWEGDLSAALRALVPRAASCIVEGLDRDGVKVRFEIDDDFHARVFQHEIDHLNGVMFIDNVIRKETISELPEWEKYWKNKKR